VQQHEVLFASLKRTFHLFCYKSRFGEDLFSPLELLIYAAELIQRNFKIFNNFCCNNIRFRKVFGIFKAFVLEPEDIQVYFVLLDEIIVGRASEAFGFSSGVDILGTFDFMP
jgi:hypothetical protein